MKTTLPAAKYATTYQVRLPNGQWLSPSWTPRPARIVDAKPSLGWEDKQQAECFASQVGGVVHPERYEYINAF
jgi:hypothetical protein